MKKNINCIIFDKPNKKNEATFNMIAKYVDKLKNLSPLSQSVSDISVVSGDFPQLLPLNEISNFTHKRFQKP
jgi:hypothetical protein